jgi:hypothetical protein
MTSPRTTLHASCTRVSFRAASAALSWVSPTTPMGRSRTGGRGLAIVRTVRQGAQCGSGQCLAGLTLVCACAVLCALCFVLFAVCCLLFAVVSCVCLCGQGATPPHTGRIAKFSTRGISPWASSRVWASSTGPRVTMVCLSLFFVFFGGASEVR